MKLSEQEWRSLINEMSEIEQRVEGLMYRLNKVIRQIEENAPKDWIDRYDQDLEESLRQACN